MLIEAISKMSSVFDTPVLLGGQECFQKGQVLSTRLSDGLLKGRVRDNSGQIYDVHMDLKTWPQTPSHCSCSQKTNCKHVAACLFDLREEKINARSSKKLDKKLDVWLNKLRLQEVAVLVKPEVTHHLHYVLTLEREGPEHKVKVELALAKRLKRGGYGKRNLFYGLTDAKKQYFVGDDEEIVAQLLFRSDASLWLDHFLIHDSELLAKILLTRRAFFNFEDKQAIQMGEETRATCQWILAPDGSQLLALMQNHVPVAPLLLDECWYVYEEESLMGPLSTPYPTKQLSYLLEAPPIPLDQAPLLAKKMAQVAPEFPLPQVFEQKKIIEILPVPVLILDALNEEEEDEGILSEWSIEWDEVEEESLNALFVAQIVFDYAGLLIDSRDSCAQVVREQEGLLLEYPRDLSFEKAKLQELAHWIHLRPLRQWEKHKWGLAKSPYFVLEGIEEIEDLERLCKKITPGLKNLGWRVEFIHPLHKEVIHADEVEWYSDLQEGAQDFFSYQLGILVEGRPVSIVPLVVDLIQGYSAEHLDNVSDAKWIQLPLEDGKFLQLEMGRIKPLVRFLWQFGMHQMDEHKNLQIQKYQLLLMQEAELALAATRLRWRGSEQFREELRQLTTLVDLPEIATPSGLNAQLRNYQQDGLSWLQFLRSSHFGGILADDMGLGKTVQTLAHLLYEKEQGRINKASLIIAPTSLVGNWLAEAKRFTPQLTCLVYHGSERHQEHFDDFDLVISTYGLIHRDKEKFIHYSFYYLILDEAQFIKNARTKTTQIIQQLQASHRLCLTGTPLENHLGELWSLFHFLIPGLLGDMKQFRSWFRTPIEKNANLERRELLAKRVKPFMLRRTKNQVASELPPKTEMIRTVEIVGSQRDLYEAVRMSMEKKVREAIQKQGLGKSHIVLLDALLKLRQVCCDPRLLSLPQASMAHGTSAKLEALMELLDNLVEEGRRVLVFSQFTSMLKLIEKELVAKQYDYLQLTGQTKNRQALVEQFQEGKTPIFLISLKAGGTGLNLTRADTVIHYDPWWNPAVEDQATDRTHRIGQERPVFVYKLIATGSVEEAILSMQERKRQLVDGILSADSSKISTFSEEDLEQFFVPLTEG